MIVLELLYLLNTTLLAIYGLNSLLLTWLHLRKGNKSSTIGMQRGLATSRRLKDYPSVTVQLPVYNERHVTERLLNAVVNLDWPAERMQVQVLDDSTDDTSQIIAAALARHRASGARMRLDQVRRSDRRGFKAGALQHGLASAEGEFIAIFDADFIPAPDFLKQTIPFFDETNVGCVQTRWGHVNPESSKLTQAQALGIDGHFVVEQDARNAVKAFLNFNGTAGVWRRTCMIDAGGWQGDTLTEDLDLSYRAQLRSWRVVYEPNVVVPAELPVQVDAFKRQQFRWAKGSIQTAQKLLPSLWRARQPLWIKLMGTLHLTNYSVHPLMLINLLLVLPMTLSNSPLLLLTPFFTIIAIAPPLLYWVAMRKQAFSLWDRISRLGLLIALGTGLSVNNARAVLEAILGLNSDFKRTPKFAVVDRSTTWQRSNYTLPRDPAVWTELILGLYAWGLLFWSIGVGVWWLIPWLILYGAGYSYISAMTFIQARQTRIARAQVAVSQP